MLRNNACHAVIEEKMCGQRSRPRGLVRTCVIASAPESFTEARLPICGRVVIAAALLQPRWWRGSGAGW